MEEATSNGVLSTIVIQGSLTKRVWSFSSLLGFVDCLLAPVIPSRRVMVS